jgi:hypothetical protein
VEQGGCGCSGGDEEADMDELLSLINNKESEHKEPSLNGLYLITI